MAEVGLKDKAKKSPGMTEAQKVLLEQIKNEFAKIKGKCEEQSIFIDALQQEIKKKDDEIQKLELISFNMVYHEDIVFPKCEKPLVSIIVPVYNQYQYTKACLYQILKNTSNVDYELILADDNSYDLTKKVQKQFKNIVYIRNSTNLGFLKNVNNAVKSAKGKYICLLNNDVIPTKDWLKYLIQTMEVHKDAGIVGGKFIGIDGQIQEAGSAMTHSGIPTWLGQGEPYNKPEFNEEKEVHYCSACGVLIKKSAWDEVGGFDEQFVPAYYEDADLAFTFKYKLKLKTYYQPKSQLVHFHNVSHYNANHSAHENRPKFCEKWAKQLGSSIYDS